MVRGSCVLETGGVCRVCVGLCAGFEIAENHMPQGVKGCVLGVQGKFKLKFVLKNKTVFLKNVSNNLKMPTHPTHTTHTTLSR